MPMTLSARATSREPTRPGAAHAIVTGAGRGIGAAIARRLAADGFQVTVLGRSMAAVAAVAAEAPDRFEAVTADVTDPAAIDSAFATARARFGPITVLVNNAGQADSAPFGRMTVELWQRMLAVNLTGPMLCSQAALPDLLAASSARIVNIASTAGLVGYGYVTAYCAAKHGVIGLTRSLALELATKGVTVNAVCPGYTETDILVDSIDRVVATTGRTAEAARAAFVRANPQRRLVLPDEVADAVGWLCGPGAAAITGQSISVSGGEVT